MAIFIENHYIGNKNIGRKMYKIESYEYKKHDPKKKIIVYGAALYGEVVINALENVGLKCDLLCDRVQAGGEFCGCRVISPAELLKYRDAEILICATKGFEGIYTFLTENGFENIFEISKLLEHINYDKLRPYCRQLGREELAEKYLFYLKDHDNGESSLDLSFVALSITERCTLKCKHCSVLAPYYRHPCDESYEEIIMPLSRFLSCVDSVAEMQVGGGEPFMNKDLKRILEWCLREPKIKEISIFTNSTIIPGEELVSVLKDNKIKLLLDDYGELSRNYGAIKELCDRENIRYLEQKFLHWDDLGNYDFYERDDAVVKKRFALCSFGNVNSFMKGKLYRCTTAARLEDIGLVEEIRGDFVDFRSEIDVEEARKQIRELLFHKDFHEGCRICRGVSNSQTGIPVAEQL